MRERVWIVVGVLAVAAIGLAAWYADWPAYHPDAHEFSKSVYPAVGSELIVRESFVASASKDGLEYVSPPVSIRDPEYVRSMILAGDAIRLDAGDRFVVLEIVEYAKPIEAARIRTEDGEFWTMAAIVDSPFMCERISSTP